MSLNKKIFSLIVIFLTINSSLLKADSYSALKPIENYDSGKLRLANIMANPETGVANYNKKNIKYAETQNIAKDLNVEQIAEFFNCKTLIGKSFITETLKFPVNPQDKNTILANRQNIIKTIVENPELKKEIEELINIAKQEEQEVIKLMSEFFIGKTCPELKALELIKEQNPFLYNFFKLIHTNPKAKTISTTFNYLSAALTLGTTAFMGKTIYNLEKQGLNSNYLNGYTAYLGLISGVVLYGVYKDYSLASEKRSKMHSLNKLITISEKIEKLSEKYNLKNQFKINSIKDSNGLELIQKLKHSRYQNKKSMFFMTPQVHTFLYDLYQQEKYFAEIFACIAEMDTYNAIATKIIESQNQKNKFCFVSFLDNEQPQINSKAFWNVLVQEPIANDLFENKNIILTGPNAGGKTTSIRSILQNIVLGQTFGIAAAEQFDFTMFDIIHSYLNISDDLINGLSLFKSEVKRAQEVLETINLLKPNQKFFFALDELFTGTNDQDGQDCAYNFINKLSKFNGIQFIYATHFNKLKELGKDGIFCINYKVDAPIKNAENKLVYPFTLNLGANESYVAMDIAREANLFA